MDFPSRFSFLFYLQGDSHKRGISIVQIDNCPSPFCLSGFFPVFSLFPSQIFVPLCQRLSHVDKRWRKKKNPGILEIPGFCGL